MTNFLRRKLDEIIAARRLRQRNGPYPSHKRLIWNLADLRNTLTDLPEPAIREFLLYAMSLAPVSRGQLFQDAFVLHVLGEKRGGFFVDFGATDGVSLSNSYLLESAFGWSGICAEPAHDWHEDLARNRPNARIEQRCVWTETGATLTFAATEMKELSTIANFSDTDSQARNRRGARTYEVRTVSLNDMLAENGAPEGFDYLSIDTEGSEFDILSRFDLARYMPKVITVEHNYTPRRHDLFALLSAQGYRRVLTEISLFDDWYLAPGIALPGA